MSPEETIAKLTETLATVKTQAGCEKCLDRAFELLDAWFVGKELDAACGLVAEIGVVTDAFRIISKRDRSGIGCLETAWNDSGVLQ